jgi:hypothetical protein
VVAVAANARVGPIAIGEAALVAAVSSAHRAEAFACADLVDVIQGVCPSPEAPDLHRQHGRMGQLRLTVRTA